MRHLCESSAFESEKCIVNVVHDSPVLVKYFQSKCGDAPSTRQKTVNEWLFLPLGYGMIFSPAGNTSDIKTRLDDNIKSKKLLRNFPKWVQMMSEEGNGEEGQPILRSVPARLSLIAKRKPLMKWLYSFAALKQALSQNLESLSVPRGKKQVFDYIIALTRSSLTQPAP